MTPEPLTKDKIFDMLGVYIFTLKDVKSAVEWLLKEIELTDLEWVVYDDGTQERMSEKERKKILRNLIKKAFSGVLRE